MIKIALLSLVGRLLGISFKVGELPYGARPLPLSQADTCPTTH